MDLNTDGHVKQYSRNKKTSGMDQLTTRALKIQEFNLEEKREKKCQLEGKKEKK